MATGCVEKTRARCAQREARSEGQTVARNLGRMAQVGAGRGKNKNCAPQATTGIMSSEAAVEVEGKGVQKKRFRVLKTG